ncbi:PAS domain S-box protein [Cytophagaceae bacterium ABcell3]|nr:PAS domain S-box protein [Cytophagaceae bacterium ABcell3]
MQFVHAKPYAGYLLKYHMESLGKEAFELFKANSFRVPEQYKSYPEEVLIEATIKDLAVFLSGIMDDSLWEASMEKIKKWEKDELDNVSREELSHKEVTIIHSVRKQVLFKFLPEYTNDPYLITSIASELEVFYSRLEKELLDIFHRVRQLEIEESRMRFKALSESSYEAIFIHENGKILLANSAAEKIFGYSAEEFANLRVFDLVEDLGEGFYEMDTFLEAEPTVYKGLCKGGKSFYAEIKKRQARYKGKSAEVFIVRDISHLKKIEENLKNHKEELQASNDQLTKQMLEREELEDVLREREQTFRLLAENSSDIIARIAPDGSFLYVSPSSEAIIGFTPRELIDTNLFNYIPSDFKDLVQQAFARCFLTDDIQVVEHKFRSKSGELVWLESTGHSIKGEEEQVVEVQVAARSIVDRKVVEQKLDKERQFLKVILDNIYDPIIACNGEGKIMFFNKAARELHGVGDTNDFADPNQWSETYKLLQEDGSTPLHEDEIPLMRAFRGETLKNVEIASQAASGEVRFFVTSGQPIYNKQQEKVGALVVMHDITSIKYAEKELTQKNKALNEAYNNLKNAQQELQATNNLLEHKVSKRTQKLNEINLNLKKEISEREKIEKTLREKNYELVKINNDLDNFVYTASHDLKAPVSNMEGLVNALAIESSECADEYLQEIIGMINISIGKFKDTLDELTEISKIQKGIHEDIDEIDVKALTEEVLASLKDLVHRSGANINLEFSKSTLKFSKKDLRSVIFNLVSNALKYRSSERPLQVDIKGGVEGEYYLLQVKDNGLGIDPAHHKKIFSMFKRLHDHVEGSGVGLYIVKRIVENNGGKVLVESKPDEGALFKVYLRLLDT